MKKYSLILLKFSSFPISVGIVEVNWLLSICKSINWDKFPILESIDPIKFFNVLVLWCEKSVKQYKWQFFPEGWSNEIVITLTLSLRSRALIFVNENNSVGIYMIQVDLLR